MTAEGVCCAGEHLQEEGQAAHLLSLPTALGSSHVFPLANLLSAQVETPHLFQKVLEAQVSYRLQHGNE